MRDIPQDIFEVTVRTKLWKKRKTITALARFIGVPRNTVSMAINHPVFPRTRAKIIDGLRRIK